MGLKWTEVLLIMAVLVLLFGASRLPQLGKSLGEGIRNFKKGFAGEDEPKDAATAEKDKLAAGNGTGQSVDAAKTKQS